MEKSDIRRKIKALRTMLSEEDKNSAAEEVFEQLEKTAAFLLADKILMYHSLPDELQTIAFLKKWSSPLEKGRAKGAGWMCRIAAPF